MSHFPDRLLWGGLSRGKVFLPQFFLFIFCFRAAERSGCVLEAPLWRYTGFLSGLNLLSVHPVGSTLYRFQFRPEELTETTLKSGLIQRAQAVVRFRLRSKSFMLRSKGAVYLRCIV